jgi:putative phosphoesterase
MRIAALYDIHGNLPALEAVLDEVRAARPDLIVIGGDVIPGPMSRESLDRVLSLDLPARYILGNCEVGALALMRGGDPAALHEQARASMVFAAGELDARHAEAMAAWPKTTRLHLPAIGDVLFCHATPRNENEIFTRLTAEDTLRPIFDAAGAALVVCGHTHMPFDRMVGRTRVVNAGSVGMPFGEAGAYWALIGPAVELKRTVYDLRAAADRIQATAYPQADAFAAGNVVAPPTEQQMLDAFSRVELR